MDCYGPPAHWPTRQHLCLVGIDLGMGFMQRVMIVGQPGSGKSTLARALGARTGLPVFHMDHIHWKAGWIERDADEKMCLVQEVHAQAAWILEGGHSASYSARVARADTYIWLDFPLGLRVWRVLRRSVVHYGRTRPDLPEGCPERFNGQMIDFLRFIWRTRKTSRLRMRAIFEDPPAHLRVYRLQDLRQVRGFLRDLPTA